MSWIKRISYNDGGRRAAGFKTVQMGDCVCRALSIVTGQDYAVTHRILKELSMKNDEHPDHGIYPQTYRRVLRKLKAGRMIKARAWEELPQSGKIFAVMEQHVVAVIDGVINDTYDPVEKQHSLQGYYRIG